MNTRKTIYEKLFRNDKTELATHEVDLALADDIKKAVDASIAYKDIRTKSWNKASTPLIALFDVLRAELGTAQTAMAGINSLKEKTKALGVEMPAKMLANEKIIGDILKTRKTKADQLKKILDQIPSLVN
jgi:hypothetical protein